MVIQMITFNHLSHHLGAKFLGFFSSRSLKTRENKYIFYCFEGTRGEKTKKFSTQMMTQMIESYHLNYHFSKEIESKTEILKFQGNDLK